MTVRTTARPLPGVKMMLCTTATGRSASKSGRAEGRGGPRVLVTRCRQRQPVAIRIAPRTAHAPHRRGRVEPVSARQDLAASSSDMKDDRVYLRHIRDAIARIDSYTSRGHEVFLAETMIQDAVIRNLEVIGEAVKNLSDSLRMRHPEVPWTRIANARRPDPPVLRCLGRNGVGSRSESSPGAQTSRGYPP